MIVAFCADDSRGVSFFGKRQSRDSEVIKDIMSFGLPVHISTYSAPLFEGYDVIIEEDFSQSDCDGEICFCEKADPLIYSAQAEKIIVYNWNRAYPSDKKYSLAKGFVLSDEYDFKGNSHENITRKIYVREDMSNGEEKENRENSF